MLLGCDLSTEYQSNFDVTKAYNEGIRFLAVKLSDGTKGTEKYEAGIDIIKRAQSLRMVCFGYHFLRAGVNPVFQAEMFADQLNRAGCSGMLDLENGTLDECRETFYHTTRLGGRVSFTYLPHWFWVNLGSPSLAGLPPLWGSRFVSDANKVEVTGTPAKIAAGIKPEWWNPYGNKSVEILQFTSKATIAGLVMDADVYRGSLRDLEKLV